VNLESLHKRLNELGISENSYFLHGLYGSTNDNEKISLTIRRGKYSIEYVTYFKERGKIHSEVIFTNETDACKYLYKKLVKEWLYWKMKENQELERMTVNERLHSTGLSEIYDKYKNEDNIIIEQILKLIKVDNNSIKK
jgi:hypothetical protein